MRKLLAIILSLGMAATMQAQNAQVKYFEIQNDCFWNTADGKYLLQFKMMNASKLKKATVSVVSGGKTFTKKLSTAAHDWQAETFEVEVKNGKATLMFHIEGKAQAECRIDDIQLTMIK